MRAEEIKASPIVSRVDSIHPRVSKAAILD